MFDHVGLKVKDVPASARFYAAILKPLGAVVASQDKLHERFGGVVPEIASRAHVERILPVIDDALRNAGAALADIGAVAVATRASLFSWSHMAAAYHSAELLGSVRGNR